jgi:hypothetical protein
MCKWDISMNSLEIANMLDNPYTLLIWEDNREELELYLIPNKELNEEQVSILVAAKWYIHKFTLK